MPDRRTEAQRVSLKSLALVASAAVHPSGGKLVKMHEPVPLHAGEYASLLVKVEMTDPTIKKDPASPLEPWNMMVNEFEFLIEAGGCIARIYR